MRNEDYTEDNPREIEPEVTGESAGEYNIELARSSGATKERSAELFEEGYEGDGQLVVDVYQTPEEIIIESPIAGVDPDNLDVSITAESVTIRGSRSRDKKIKDEDYFYQECYWGKFSRSIILPQEIDAEKAEATINNGVLTVLLPKLNRQKQKKLRVKLH